jgi:hypothetical protein
MTTTPNDTTIHIPDNMPVDAKRLPQLGDTQTHFGGDPLPQVDATFPVELRPKGLANNESGSETGTLGEVFGGHPPAPLSSPEKNILQTPVEEESSISGHGEPESAATLGIVATQASLSWTDGAKVVWFIRNEAESMIHEFANYAQADAYFEANERTRWLVPGQDEEPGFKAASPAPQPGAGASAASDTLTQDVNSGEPQVGTPGTLA